MIPSHFRSSQPSESSDDPKEKVVTLTIKQPQDHLTNGIAFPDAPTTLGKVTETITKSTLTETVVTRVTDNKLANPVPVIIEVCSSQSLPFPSLKIHCIRYLFFYSYFSSLLLEFFKLSSSIKQDFKINSIEFSGEMAVLWNRVPSFPSLFGSQEESGNGPNKDF